MGLKKESYSSTSRTGTLLFLYLFLIINVWSLLSLLTSLGDSMYKEFLRENKNIFYAAIFSSLFGGGIFLVTIISITLNRPSVFLLCTAIAFLFLHAIHGVHSMYQYISSGAFDNLFNAKIEKQVRELPISDQNVIRIEMKNEYPILLKSMYAFVTLAVIAVFYAVLLFRRYIIELMESSLNSSPSRKISQSEEVIFLNPAYNSL